MHADEAYRNGAKLNYMVLTKIFDRSFEGRTTSNSWEKIKSTRTRDPSIVPCTCNPVTLEAEFQNSVGLISVRGNSASIVGLIL